MHICRTQQDIFRVFARSGSAMIIAKSSQYHLIGVAHETPWLHVTTLSKTKGEFLCAKDLSLGCDEPHLQ
jgi:hypothetical protein